RRWSQRVFPHLPAPRARTADKRVQAAARHARVEFAAEGALAELGRRQQSVDIDAGSDAHRLEEIHQVLRRDVAGVPLAVLDLRWMPADAAEGAVEPAYAGFVRRDVVHQSRAPGVVEVRERPAAPRAAEERLHR